MKNLLKLLVALLFLSGCENKSEQTRYYLFETADYCDFDDSLEVIYIKSHRQLIKDTTFYTILKCAPGPCYRVYNALGQEFSINNIFHEYYPKTTIDTLDPSYDITLHLHDNTLTITIPFEPQNLDLTRYYMIETYKVDSVRSVFQFLDPLSMVKEIEREDETTYILYLENYKDIDFEGGERVVLEYDTYKIPVPYQIFGD
jgi:hypothetical protein